MAEATPDFFANLNPIYAAITLEDGQIPTKQFLEASAEMAKIFEFFGKAFAMVKSDVNGNIQKLTKCYEANPEGFSTLHKLIKNDVDKGETKSTKSATCFLLWFKRTLQYISILLHKLHEGAGEVSECATLAYQPTLAKHHGWATRQVFNLAVKASPTKASFLAKLGPDEAVVLTGMAQFLSLFDPLTENIVAMYDSFGIEQ
eukprot:TRINITY_DN36671_c0_g1_i1.p1 TRINITY_DN36671_c0_g1~~TRINITY_DN36671_c0_g1_i1.p1  ORF type:complete len:202 (+),score=52.69 TRINITY_DN36671_c0_g1_i1:129-734(+)